MYEINVKNFEQAMSEPISYHIPIADLQRLYNRYSASRISKSMPSNMLFNEVFGPPLSTIILTSKTSVWTFSTDDITIYILVNIEGIHFEVPRNEIGDTTKYAALIEEIVETIEQYEPPETWTQN